MQIDRHELKQIRLHRQHLTNRADRLTVARDLCGLQAQFLPCALHALRIRATDYDEATVADGLVKNWTVRGTVHVFAEADLPLFLHCNNGRDYRSNDWHGYRFWNSRANWALTPERQSELSSAILDALKDGPRSRDDLKVVCRAVGMTETEEDCMFMAWGGGMRELCERGFCNYVVEERKAFCLAPDFTPIPEEEANREIVRRYLTHMAPATLRDLCYYLKCPQKQARAWLSALPVKTLTVEGREHFYLGDLPSDCADIPDCLFLAGFDQLLLAYEKKDSIYLPEAFLRGIFNLAGIVMPPILLDGEICGRWKKTGHKLELHVFRDLSGRDKALLEETAMSTFGDIKNILYH